MARIADDLVRKRETDPAHQPAINPAFRSIRCWDVFIGVMCMCDAARNGQSNTGQEINRVDEIMMAMQHVVTFGSLPTKCQGEAKCIAQGRFRMHNPRSERPGPVVLLTLVL